MTFQTTLDEALTVAAVALIVGCVIGAIVFIASIIACICCCIKSQTSSTRVIYPAAAPATGNVTVVSSAAQMSQWSQPGPSQQQAGPYGGQYGGPYGGVQFSAHYTGPPPYNPAPQPSEGKGAPPGSVPA
ncbi:hypothetical protein C0Q70_14605 [Pomacea canaliculata]|uniref:Cysteine and tyrosine-rich protein 1 n=1 Tax=Pomacea canaliculata TaxID=400727 RepID=A0A2T7NSI5_POMCA|nr:hypothetical protein C0Q70_14605 [Pomacea canaliculata]